MPDSHLTDVFLARHGETEWNVVGRRQGRLDSPLTAKGRLDVGDVAARIRSVPIDAVASSPLGRAVTTAAMFGDALSVEVHIVDNLAEIDHGLWTGLTDEEVDTRFPGGREIRSANLYTWRYPEGESYEDADHRAAKALGNVFDLGGQRLLIVSHAMIGRMLLKNLLDLSVEDVLGRPQPHHLVRHVDLREHQFADLE
jgi:broad specificity phosphatase PhoE